MPDDELIYLDHNATTPLDPRVLEVMQPFFAGNFGNAASRHHRLGRQASAAVEAARVRVAAVLGAEPREVYLTSGATEANNLALKGLAASKAYAKRRHIVTVRTEHRAVLQAVCQPAAPLYGFKRGHMVFERAPVSLQRP